METHPSLFHPDHHLTVVKGGREEVREVDTRRIVLGQIEGNTPSYTQISEFFELQSDFFSMLYII